MATGYNDTHRYKNYIVEDTISVYPAMYPTWLNYAFFVHPDTQIQEIRNRINCIRITDTKPLMFWIDYLCATGSTLQPDQLPDQLRPGQLETDQLPDQLRPDQLTTSCCCGPRQFCNYRGLMQGSGTDRTVPNSYSGNIVGRLKPSE